MDQEIDQKIDQKINEIHLRPIPIPQRYITVEEFCEVRVNRTLVQETHFEVSQRQQLSLSILEPQLAEKIAEYARQKGMSPEALINLWLTERFAAETQSGQ